MLCKNPLIQEKIAQEVKDVACSQENEPKIDEFVNKITDSTLEKMHYLHAALTETLRLYPAVPVVRSKINLLTTDLLFYIPGLDPFGLFLVFLHGGIMGNIQFVLLICTFYVK